MENEKCPFCGQSDHCKLIVRNRRLVEAAVYAIETHECFKGKVTYCDCSICKLRKALTDETAG